MSTKSGRAIVLAMLLAAPAGMLYTLWADPLSAGEDDVVYYYPLRVLVGQSLAKGEWPLHNPLEATGVPLMADPQSAVLHPPTWLFAVLEPHRAYALNLFLAFSLAGLGAWLYLRRLGLVAAAATLGTLAFMFSGFMIGHRVHLSVVQTAAMLPWGLWCIEGMRREKKHHQDHQGHGEHKEEGRDHEDSYTGGGLELAFTAMVPVAVMALTAGHWPTFIHVSIIWLAYLLLRARPLAPALVVAGGALAVAGAICWPQIDATMQWMAQATRQKIGYAMLGENSFYPAAGALAFFPFLYGCRTPNVFGQSWWGPWHLCEMLGYVGLVTLVLAAGALWKLQPDDFWRRVGVRWLAGRLRRGRRENVEQALPPNPRDMEHDSATGDALAGSLRPLVRAWTWMLIGAGLWMLGYYLPTYRLIHMVPVLNVVRCPARMLLAADMGLAVLAAVAVHAVVLGGGTGTLGRAAARLARVHLPIVMAGWLAAVAVGALLVGWLFPGGVPGLQFWAGGPAQAWQALRPTNPAILVPLALLVLTVVVLRAWLAQPSRRAWLVAALLAADLFVPARFVDVPREPTPQGLSPAGRLLREKLATEKPFRIWALSDSYHTRARELLLPKYCESLGLATIANYGSMQSPRHAHLLGLRIFGTTDDWATLLRRNYLLSLYNVRYILAADARYRAVIESVRTPTGPPPQEGPELLGGTWTTENSQLADGVLRLRTSFMWRWSIARHDVTLEPGRVYRLSLEARSAAGGAGNFVRAEFFRRGLDGDYFTSAELGLSVHPEHLGPQWRRFEWCFVAPPHGAGRDLVRVFTMSERLIEVRSVSLRLSQRPQPLDLTGRLAPGEPVYRPVGQPLPPEREGDEPVWVYENRLCLGEQLYVQATAENVEALRRLAPDRRGLPPVPDLSVRVARSPQRAVWTVMLPALAAYGVLAGAALWWTRRKR